MATRKCKAVVVVTLTMGTGVTALSAEAQTTGDQTNTEFAYHGEVVTRWAANGAAPSCTDGNSLSRRVDFASLDRARHILEHRDAWGRQLSHFDLGIRQKTAAPTGLQEFLAFAANAGLNWTTQEAAGWKAVVDKLGQAMKGLNLRVPNIDLIKTTGAEEFDAAYTREDAIIFPQSKTSRPSTNPRGAYFLLAHEMFHVLSRADAHLRDELYALLGFKKVKRFEYPTELEERRVSNPDTFEYLHSLTVQSASGSVDVLPVNQSLLPLNQAIQLPNFFAALDIVLLSVDAGTGKVRRDANGNLIKYNFGNTNWVPLMLRNSSFIIHPEEVLADNFATLMEWRADGVLQPVNAAGFPLNDVNLLVSIQGVMERGCRK